MLRDGIPVDAEAIECVRIAAWRAAYKEYMPAKYLTKLDASENIERLRVRLASQDVDFCVSVAEKNNAVVAFSILGRPRYEAPCDTMELWALNVHPQYWRKRHL